LQFTVSDIQEESSPQQ